MRPRRIRITVRIRRTRIIRIDSTRTWHRHEARSIIGTGSDPRQGGRTLRRQGGGAAGNEEGRSGVGRGGPAPRDGGAVRGGDRRKGRGHARRSSAHVGRRPARHYPRGRGHVDPGRRSVPGRERSGSRGGSVMERGERVGHRRGSVRG